MLVALSMKFARGDIYTAARPTPLTTMPVIKPFLAGGNHLIEGGVVAE